MQVLELLQQHQHVVLDESYDSGLEDRTEEPEASKGEVLVWGNLVAFVERLDDELFKSLQVWDWNWDVTFDVGTCIDVNPHRSQSLISQAALCVLSF